MSTFFVETMSYNLIYHLYYSSFSRLTTNVNQKGEKMKNIDIRTLDLETDQLDNKITILEAEVSLNKNTSNQNYSIRMKPNSTTLLHCGAFAAQGTSKDLKASDRVSTYEGAKTIFNNLSNRQLYSCGPQC